MSKTDPTEATDERDAATWKARINRLIDSLDERTAHQNRGLSKQPPESWSPGERHAWCVGFLEGGNVLANGVRTILAAFVKETGLDNQGEEDSEKTPLS